MIPRLVIFDMDGTLVNSMPQLRENALDVLGRHFNMPANRAKDHYEATVGIPFRHQLIAIFGTEDPRIDRAVNDYEGMHIIQAFRFPLGVYTVPVLQEVHRRRIKTAVVSSTSKVIIRAMPQVQSLGVNFLFGHAQGVDKDAQIAKACMYAGHVRPYEALYIGDSDSDGALAAQMGIPFQQADVNTMSVVMAGCFAMWDVMGGPVEEDSISARAQRVLRDTP